MLAAAVAACAAVARRLSWPIDAALLGTYSCHKLAVVQTRAQVQRRHVVGDDLTTRSVTGYCNALLVDPI
jgi:hypothetical protein